MGKKLSKAPVYYTVVQVQFNPILDLDGYIPAIQSKMREEKFPDFKREIIQQLVLPFGNIKPEQMAAPTLTPQTRYVFGDMSGRSLFLLVNNALSFQTTNYETFEIFSETMMKGLGILNDALRLNFVDRIGLRYLDAVQPMRDGESILDFLVPQVIGLSQREGIQLQHSISETIAVTPVGQLISRVIIRNGLIGLPIELSDPATIIDPRFTSLAGLHAIVDTDASVTNREPFNIIRIDACMTSLHDEIDKAFKSIVTKHALASWA